MQTAKKVVSSASEGPPPVLAGRYRLGERLGGGGGGEILRAVDERTGTARALKLFAPSEASGTEAALRELEHLATLDHPHIVRAHDFGRADAPPYAGRPFLVLDLVEGTPLEAIANLPEADRLERWTAVVAQLADALAYLHGRGLVHGDLSAANVRLDAAGRAVLLDFGLAAPVGRSRRDGRVQGTLGYLAPEALLGERTPLTDLFALGATLFAAWAGAPPFGVGVEAIRRMQQPAPRLVEVRPGLPAVWDDLCAELLAFEPEERPPTAREVLRRALAARADGQPPLSLDLTAPFPTGDPLAGLFVGRAPQRQALAALLEQLREGRVPHPVAIVEGPPGSGRRALIRRALRDARLAHLSADDPGFDIEDESLVDAGAAEAPPTDQLLARAARLASRWAQQAARRPLCVVLEPGPEALAVARFIAAEEPSGRLLLLLPAIRSLAHPGVSTVALPPWGVDDVRALASRGAGETAACDEATAVSLHRISAGQPAVAIQLVRRWLEGIRNGGPGLATEAHGDLDSLLDAGFARLSSDGQRRRAAEALTDDQERARGWAALTEAAWEDAGRELRASGWAIEDAPSDGGRGAHALHDAAALRALAARALAPVAEAALPHLQTDDPRRAQVLVALGRTAAAAAAFAEAGRAALARGRLAAGAEALDRALALSPGQVAAADRLQLAEALGALGRAEEACAAIDQVDEERLTPAEGVRFAERRAWLLGRRGQLARAREGLAATLARMEETAPRSEGVFTLRARLARLTLASGHLDQALALAARVPEAAGEAWLVAQETTALARAYTGDTAGATAVAEALLANATGADADRTCARGHALRGLAAQLGGDQRRARADHLAATRAYERAGDLHGLATSTLNLGCVLADTGQYSEALSTLERSVRLLDRIGAHGDRAIALFNVGVLLARLGDAPAGERILDRLRLQEPGDETPLREACATCLEADLRRLRGQPERARDLYVRAAEAFTRAGNAPLALAARLGQAEALSSLGRTAEALAVAEAAAPGDGLGGAPEPVTLTRARLSLVAGGTVDVAEARSLVDRLVAVAERASAEGRAVSAWRASVLAARLCARIEDQRGPALREQARARQEELKMQTPERYRRALDDDPDAWRPASEVAPGGRPADEPRSLLARAELAEGRLRRLSRINKRLNSELRLGRLLETIIDTVIELTDAERGFLLLRDESGELQAKVARNIDERTLDGPAFTFSRSIARQVAEHGEPIVTIDAVGDERFREAASVGDLRLRSVLAVPLAVKGSVVGVIYVDHRLRRGAFREDDVGLVVDFAEQGAIAVENARLLSELRRRERQVDALNRRLEADLAARHQELAEIRQEMKESRQAQALRYDYRQIIGRTPRMMELFRLLDRVTDTSLPVVIQGESGTGKELVARAIHHNGARREKPFVTENCAAIPETLLESTLFGYVRGAFTGAERDTRGLFSVAHGGTLFLDEVGEMSPAMQGKLLRVLQEGEFRRVGGERTERVDVRIIVATNLDLARLVEERKFRQDLYYRLAVVRIDLPPLRERREDIPLLLQHFLTKQGRAEERGAPKELEPAALTRLMAYRWPGNVRELENEITRAGAFAGDRITAADLSPRIASGDEEAIVDVTAADDVQLRPRVERLERALVREALARCKGNQTRAAELLGLSRFGLQKKLQRYRIVP